MALYIFDASVLVKAIVPPRREKRDAILEDQKRLYQLARAQMEAVQNGQREMVIPSVALLEVGAVVKRLTGSVQTANLAVTFLKTNSRYILSDIHLVHLTLEIAIQTGCRAVDGFYLASAKHMDAVLLTDDRRMYELAIQEHISAQFLRNL